MTVDLLPVLLFGLALGCSAAPRGEDLDSSIETGAGATISSREEIRILLVGDSTVASYPKTGTLRGWGQLFPERFDNRVSFQNAAVGGRSSKSFIDEGRWEAALTFRPTHVFIQFGHNDQPGKGPTRETDPSGSYRDYLRRYIRDSRAAGAEPVLVTSVARRTFQKGRLTDTLRPWVEAAMEVGREEKVPVIDLHRASQTLFESLGDAAGSDLNAGGLNDRTHFSEKGARLVARLVAEQIPDRVPSLVPYLNGSALAGSAGKE
ncbi:MAG: rhamnogalacturonan acetylesterase [Kiritimatiellia bacterium]|nr:rhamnogalacturonan acetylesterase [Kiritimatiellia bacterium]